MLDEVAPEILIVAGAGSVLVCLLMVLVWFVSTREEKQKKKDEDKDGDGSGKQAKKKMKHHVSPRKKKEFTVPKKDLSKEETPTEIAEQPKSILKDTKEEPSPKPQRVDFKKELPVKSKPSAVPRVNPPTPHPQSEQRLPSLNKTDEAKVKTNPKDDKKQVQDIVQPAKSSPKPKSSVKSTADTSAPSERQIQTVPAKKKPKTKQASTNEGKVYCIVRDTHATHLIV